MALPGVNITLDNGQPGGTAAAADGIAGLILTGAAVNGKLVLGQAYRLSSLKEAEEQRGILAAGSNAYAHKHIKAFYDAAGTGSELWILLVAPAVTMQNMLDKTESYAPTLLNAANGAIRLLGVSRRKQTAAATLAHGLDQDTDRALVKGQVLADEFATNFKPFRFVVDGKEWNGSTGDLKDYYAAGFNRGAVLPGATDDSKNAAVGLVIGLLARAARTAQDQPHEKRGLAHKRGLPLGRAKNRNESQRLGGPARQGLPDLHQPCGLLGPLPGRRPHGHPPCGRLCQPRQRARHRQSHSHRLPGVCAGNRRRNSR